MSPSLLDKALPAELAGHLAGPLPGRDAHAAFAHQMSYGRHYGPAPGNCRQAAVLLLLRWDGTQWLLPMLRRPEGRDVHAGQICLPGGGLNAEETHESAALRECTEELGWTPRAPQLLGELSPLYVYASNNLVRCIVATTHELPVWSPDEREVAELLELPLQQLCDRAHRSDTTITRGGVTMAAGCYRFADAVIWGATAMFLAELVAILTRPRTPTANNLS